MGKSTIPFLINICAVVLFISCASNPMQGFTETAVQNPIFNATYFSDPAIDYVDKTNISVYGKSMSGIFIAKKINDTIHRVVFTTEFGNKLLDFEIGEAEFKINSIVDELNRKLLIKTLRDDFRLLLRKKFEVQEQFDSVADHVYKSKNGNHYNYIFVSKTTKSLFKILRLSKRKEKLYIAYESEKNIFAERIVIQHYNIDLKIEFNYFKPETN